MDLISKAQLVLELMKIRESYSIEQATKAINETLQELQKHPNREQS
jgi:hypothetical protein